MALSGPIDMHGWVAGDDRRRITRRQRAPLTRPRLSWRGPRSWVNCQRDHVDRRDFRLRSRHSEREANDNLPLPANSSSASDKGRQSNVADDSVGLAVWRASKKEIH